VARYGSATVQVRQPRPATARDAGRRYHDVRFFGGQYGILTRMPPPSWQFTAVDGYFEGQREAAIRETSAVGLTLIRPTFHSVPTAVAIDKDQSENLWIRDARLEDVNGPALLIARTGNQRNEINMENIGHSRRSVECDLGWASARLSSASPAATGRCWCPRDSPRIENGGLKGRLQARLPATRRQVSPAM